MKIFLRLLSLNYINLNYVNIGVSAKEIFLVQRQTVEY